jgi:hypothetical protein
MKKNNSASKTSIGAGNAHKKTIPAVRRDAQAGAVIERLRTEATVLRACEKAKMSRTQFYRLYKNDHEFRARADEALAQGIAGRCDAVEEKLNDLMEKGDIRAIKMYLPSYRAAYSRKVAGISATSANIEEKLTDEEKSIIDRALRDVLPKKDELTKKNGNE